MLRRDWLKGVASLLLVGMHTPKVLGGVILIPMNSKPLKSSQPRTIEEVWGRLQTGAKIDFPPGYKYLGGEVKATESTSKNESRLTFRITWRFGNDSGARVEIVNEVPQYAPIVMSEMRVEGKTIDYKTAADLLSAWNHNLKENLSPQTLYYPLGFKFPEKFFKEIA